MSSDATPSTDAESTPTPESTSYILVSSDKKPFKISDSAIRNSVTLSSLVGSCGLYSDKGEQATIPVDNMNSTVLEKIVTWCEHHKVDKPVDSRYPTEPIHITDWDRHFMPVDNETLFDLIQAVNYLDIPVLMVHLCRKVSEMAAGKSPEELRITFGIPTDSEDDENERKQRTLDQDKSERGEVVGSNDEEDNN
ncbi:hypothetical protein L3Y34_018611 [Caenorhabditis briggsae]|uniref:Skp1-related protein n=1 Tax=Caenorhabditis briggsae TaxID=6238 RepID=A0AAE9IV25_CAEBR|nr:hypothetical protein L3Y34_018611 [Caenorhabditis briggsae]